MITDSSYAVDPWLLRETDLRLDLLPQSESVFALSNGHVGWRANLDEGEPHGLPGSYLNGVYERRPLPYAEAGYGYPEAGQTMINVTNGKIIRLLVDDEPFDLRYGRLRSHERVLDLRGGVLHRTCEWTSPSGISVRVRSTRLVSLTQRAIAAVAYEVEAIDAQIRVVVQSELVANEQLPERGGDPRVAEALESPLKPEENAADDKRLRLIHCTEASCLRVAAAADHLITGPPPTRYASESADDVARLTVTSVLEPGQVLRLEKLVAYGWSGARSLPAVRDQVEAALAGAASTGWRGLVAQQRGWLEDFWSRADVEVEGDAEIQQAVRFALFHVLQAGARAEERAIPPRASPAPGTTATRSGTPTPSSCPCSPTPSPSPWPRRCAGGSPSCPPPGTGPGSWATRAPPSPGAPSTARNAPPTGRPAPRPSTSTPMWRTRWCVTWPPPATTSSSARPPWNCWWRPPGCGAPSATTTTTAASTSTG
ncbi:hypothetical protein SVIO_100890 [Streptomyces violaceusniger]|uniref:Glycoside hydrolase family 65 N-terminal domain-containing protein n=1 Tax=Streptomyces violaceusniger TaxID=68280 RepID=A0A4D4LJJ6_STRVO|nr:hypothetical protein SVIO_100890 [Streptomyces violaceusniger]